MTHRDLKPENILLATTDEYTLVKVSDFGLSKCANSNSILSTQCGTKCYMAPEVGTTSYTNKVDIWSMGVILFNCLTGRYPFLGRRCDRLHADNYRLEFDHENWKYISEEGRKIVKETLRFDVNERPSANELLSQRRWLSKNDEIVQKACEYISNPGKQSYCS